LFARLLLRSLLCRPRRRLAEVAAVALGTGAASALLAVFLSVGDRVAAELRRYGANLRVTPAGASLGHGATLAEADLPGVRNHFWRNNVVGLAPFLSVEAEVEGKPAPVVGTWSEREIGSGAEACRAGLRTIAQAWKIEGAWMEGPGQAMVGASLARAWGVRAGHRLRVAGREVAVAGVVSTGGEEDAQVFVDLALAQEIAGRPGRIDRVLVSAVTNPEAELADRLSGSGASVASLARRLRTDPAGLPPDVVERFACTPYPTSIAIAIERSVPNAAARPIRQATETEGVALERVRGAFFFLAAFAAAAAVLGVLAAVTADVIDRRSEIGLLKALGASDARVASLFLAEAAAVGLLGGGAGFAIGAAASRAIGTGVFGSPLPVPPSLAVLSLLGAVAAALLGAAVPLREVARVHPRTALHQA
jgi:putative ABC transport system permease protein